MKLVLSWTNHAAARVACERWHYSGSVPTPPLNVLGVWEGGEFKGVVVFSRGAASHLHVAYGLPAESVCELSRVALREHVAPVSKIVSVALRLLSKRYPSMKLVVSFADPHEGHHGGIYQAGGWFYLGTSAASVAYFDSSGRRWHSRQVSAKGFNTQYGQRRECKRPDELTKVPLPGKHRYVLPLDAAVRAQLEAKRQPYPKRDGKGSPAGTTSGEGGSIPTPSLHEGSSHAPD